MSLGSTRSRGVSKRRHKDRMSVACMEKNPNEANKKNPKLMSRLEIISQNLFWLRVAAPTCQTSCEAGSSGGGCCCPEGASEMKRGFVNTRLYPGLEKGRLGPGQCSRCSLRREHPAPVRLALTHATPLAQRAPAEGCPKTARRAFLPSLMPLCMPEKHRGSKMESKI